MAILIDPPRWPAHGTLFSHLISDVSLVELHAFAAAAGLPPRAFDHDHYDVPERRYDELVARGAIPVSATALVRRLVASGLRTRPTAKTPSRSRVLRTLPTAWAATLPGAPGLGELLLARWGDPKRSYHDVRHLGQCLAALDLLAEEAPVGRPVKLAAWFHDAVYTGRPGFEEDASAQLAAESLPAAGLDAAECDEVVRLVLLTKDHDPTPDDLPGAQLCDADLSILGQSVARYHMYVRDVRQDFEHVPHASFAPGRLAVVARLLERDPIYHTKLARRLWEKQARANLTEELAFWHREIEAAGAVS